MVKISVLEHYLCALRVNACHAPLEPASSIGFTKLLTCCFPAHMPASTFGYENLSYADWWPWTFYKSLNAQESVAYTEECRVDLCFSSHTAVGTLHGASAHQGIRAHVPHLPPPPQCLGNPY